MNLVKRIKENKKVKKIKEKITILTGGIASSMILLTSRVYADSTQVLLIHYKFCL